MVVHSSEESPAELQPLNDVRKAIFEAQRQKDRSATVAAAQAEERAQVLATEKLAAQEALVDELAQKLDAEGKPLTIEQVHAGGPSSIELLHAQIRLMRQKAPANAPPQPVPARITERTRLEMEAGKRAVERAGNQRQLEMEAGARVAAGYVYTPPAELPTPSTPVHVPAQPTAGVDQNKPFKTARRGR